MYIDRFLSRFKIQTKVIIFIMPFVISISAVGLMGLYASGLLQSRMETSNAVLKSLTGFRDVSSSMAKFLENTTKDTKEAVLSRLNEQRETLASDLADRGDQDKSSADISEAISLIGAVQTNIDDLEKLHSQQVALMAELQKGIGIIGSTKTNLREAEKKLRVESKAMENEAKDALINADRIGQADAAIQTMLSQFDGAMTAEAKFDVVAKGLNDFTRQVRLLSVALPPKDVGFAKERIAVLNKFKKLLKQEKTDETVAQLANGLAGFRGSSDFLKAAATWNMKTATEKFSEIGDALQKADDTIAQTDSVIEAGYNVNIFMSRFMLQPDDANRVRLAQEFNEMRKRINGLTQNVEGYSYYAGLTDKLSASVDMMDKATVDLVKVSADRQRVYEAAENTVGDIWTHLTGFASVQQASAGKERAKANNISVGTTVVGILIAIFAGIGLVLTFRGPIGHITSTMRRLADGQLDVDIAGARRRDEIGDMARALGVFKENALAKVRIEAESEKQRDTAEADRARHDAERKANEEQIAFAVRELAAGLEHLSNGDLTMEITAPFAGQLDNLRLNFNASLKRLNETLSQIQVNAVTIQESGSAMRGSSDDLSRRTESQAAILEQTAAAVDEITTTVRQSAERANEVNGIVSRSRGTADQSTKVMGDALEAMSRIEKASTQIEQIIGVIEDIAFQTNLLALNAGIEAARAGDAGKGFAVVAMEVRELAQRSSEAAKQIKGLIDAAAHEVADGSVHVKGTSKALNEISGQIAEISQHINLIAVAAQDQATALHEVNTTVNQMDQMTQANAAMAEEGNALSQQLELDANSLMELLSHFRFADHGGAEAEEADKMVA